MVLAIAGPITNSINSLSEFFERFVNALSGGLDPTTTKWLVDQSVYFNIVAVAVLMMKFYFDIAEANTKRKGDDKIIGLGSSLVFLGFRLAWIPLIMFASAIPGVFLRMTPSAFAATTSTAKKVAGVGDGLLDQLGNYWTMTMQGGARQILAMSDDDGAKLTPEQRTMATKIQQAYGNAGSGLNAAKQAYEDAVAGGANKNTLASLKNRMTDAQAFFTNANTALARFAQSVKPRLDSSATAATIEAAKQDLVFLRALRAQGATSVDTISMKSFLGASQRIESRGFGTVENFLQKKIDDATIPKAPQAFGITDVPGVLVEFLGNVGFYACNVPALLGIIAGGVISMKEALAIMQFGAKVDVMKGLALTLASLFAPIFMLSFLFQKTEQFGWKFVSFLFSVYFGVYGITYACGVVGNVGFGALLDTVSSLVAVPTGYRQKEASQALFMSSVGIGLKALGVGLVTAFASDIVKSALSVGQGPFNGNFNA
jgi:hypothetical protein